MINVREFQALQTQLLKEGNERFELQEVNKQLMSRVKMLERDLAKKEYELTVAAAANAITTQDDIHELVENNVALKEQVRALKGMLDAMQSVPLHAGDPQSVARTTTTSQDMTDFQTVLGKLTAKEEELSAIRVECRMWEEQLMQLKFDLQSERFQSQTLAKAHLQQAKAASCSGSSGNKDAPPLSSINPFGFPSNSPSKQSAELQQYKALAMQRAEYWKLSEMALDQANSEIARLKQAVATLEERHLQMGGGNASDSKHQHSTHDPLQSVEAAVDEARKETKLAQDTLTQAMKELARLQEQVRDMPLQYTIETKRLRHLVRDLQSDLAGQKTAVDQLKSAALLYSPRNSRGIDVSRKKAPGNVKHISF
ncbi:hypothetical protein H257_04807 [Aphanomyces astaci]|uniref:Uncharacterized protein n=1 Tax=Aphanomyces astaci TaxID=112090 RepID=W4GVZ8_APHAT|nr:hypothetical protein H257_04807 [Aphanomyces astaci]ETV83068.1 hypothetical protein H257_04807 [Aphanomyces astaci]|eukprot:XP_009827739.1 hypothetical protein H257_04807 [Aphanomyces astaci]